MVPNQNPGLRYFHVGHWFHISKTSLHSIQGGGQRVAHLQSSGNTNPQTIKRSCPEFCLLSKRKQRFLKRLLNEKNGIAQQWICADLYTKWSTCFDNNMIIWFQTRIRAWGISMLDTGSTLATCPSTASRVADNDSPTCKAVATRILKR